MDLGFPDNLDELAMQASAISRRKKRAAAFMHMNFVPSVGMAVGY